jgi:DNA modification methylase
MELHNGNCLEMLPQLGAGSIDCVIVDLPYGQTACDWDSKIDLLDMWAKLKPICKVGCNYVFFCTAKFGNELINSNPTWFRYDLVWEKNIHIGFLNAKKMPLRTHELIYVFGDPKSKGKLYNPQKTAGLPYKRCEVRQIGKIYGSKKMPSFSNETGDRHPYSILKYNSTPPKGEKRVHPTQKPIDLCEFLVKSFSNEGDTVLDFTMGSGSTGVACKNTGRAFIGIEMDKEIFEIAQGRLI